MVQQGDSLTVGDVRLAYLEGRAEHNRKSKGAAEVARMFRTMIRAAFPFEEYEKMAVPLRSLNGRAIVSLNDHPDIRRVFDGFHIETVPIQYTVGGGRGVERNELIIFSWDDAAQPVGLF
ncbi:hypothetical protein WJ94_25735 [Burkholderia ubonensis]|nr:hypothetical protein WJ94_25735 [Burkholderia ubonensis]KVR44857.1 hypothetical protein WK18_15190 [Burkholderia ubonensis]